MLTPFLLTLRRLASLRKEKGLTFRLVHGCLGIYLNILVYEHACGGGFAEGAVSPGILAEGFGMLRAFVSNLKAAGHEVTVILDEGLSRLNPPIEANCVIPIFSFKEAQQAILKACAEH